MATSIGLDKSDFFERVYQVVRKIPHGRVCTYGAVARAIGAPGAARTVGYAMNASHNLPDVPAHRVVNRNGMLTGKHHFPGKDTMQRLLAQEGIMVEEDCVLNFEELLWLPEPLI
jgi:methylated-DNA-protein-cysteine methyltransferase-like protein